MRPTFLTAASLLLASSSVFAIDFSYGTCKPLLSIPNEVHDYDFNKYDRQNDGLSIVVPFQNPQVDRKDYKNLVPNKQASLYYAENAPNAKYAAILNFAMDWPTVIAENSDHISKCECDGSKISLSFKDEPSYNYATQWPQDNFVLVTNSPGCSAQQNERGKYLINKVEFDSVSRSVYCYGENKKWDEIADTMKVSFGPARPGYYAGTPEVKSVTKTITKGDGSVTTAVVETTVTPLKFSKTEVADKVHATSVSEWQQWSSSKTQKPVSTTKGYGSSSATSSGATTSESSSGVSTSDSSSTYTTQSSTTLNLGSTTTTVSIPAGPTELSEGARVAYAEIMKVIEKADDGSYFVFPIPEKLAKAAMPEMASPVFDFTDTAAQLALANEVNSYPGYDTAAQIDALADQALAEAATQPYGIKPEDNLTDNFPTESSGSTTGSSSTTGAASSTTDSSGPTNNPALRRRLRVVSDRSAHMNHPLAGRGLSYEGNVINLSDILARNTTDIDLEKRDDDWWVDLGFGVLGFLGEVGCKICALASDLKDLYDGIKSLKEAIEYLRDGMPAKATGYLDGRMELQVPAQKLSDRPNKGTVSISDAGFKVLDFHVEAEMLVRLKDNVVVAGEIITRWNTNSNLQFKVEAGAADAAYLEFTTKDVALNALEAPGVFKISPKMMYLFGIKYNIASAGTYLAGAYSELRGAHASIDVEQKKLKPGYGSWKPSRIDLTFPSFKEGQAATMKPYIKSTIAMDIALFGKWNPDAISVSTQTWFAYEGSILTAKESNECKKGALKIAATLDSKADMAVFKKSPNNLDTQKYQLGQRCFGGKDDPPPATTPRATTLGAPVTTPPAAATTPPTSSAGKLCGVAGWAKAAKEDFFTRFPTYAQCQTWCIAQGGKSYFSTPEALGGHCMCYKTSLADGLTLGPGSIPNWYDASCPDPNPVDKHDGPIDAPAGSCPSGYTNRQFFTKDGRKFRIVCGKELDTSQFNRGTSANGAAQWQTFDDCARGCVSMGYPWCSAFVFYPDAGQKCAWLGSIDNAIKDNARAAYAVAYP